MARVYANLEGGSHVDDLANQIFREVVERRDLAMSWKAMTHIGELERSAHEINPGMANFVTLGKRLLNFVNGIV